jgi:hypothetical protein
MKTREGILQFPFLMGMVFTFYLFFQGIVLYIDRETVPEDALTRAFFMMALCCICCWTGYRIKPRWIQVPIRKYDPKRLLLCGGFLILIGWFGFYKLCELTGGGLSFYSTNGGYSYAWEGLPVRYNFLKSMIYPGIILCLASHHLRPTRKSFIVVILGFILPLADIIFMGRRSVAIWVFLVVMLYLYFMHRFLLPRSSAPVLVLLSLLGLFVGPSYRQHSQLDADHSQILNINLAEQFQKATDPTRIDAFTNGVYIIGAFTQTANYGLGSIFYDAIIRSFVPRQLVGEETQASMMFHGNFEFVDNETSYVYGFVRHSNEFFCGFAELFSQFWYLGCFYYFILGMFFHTLWVRSVNYGCITSKIFYLCLIVFALTSVAFSPSSFFVSFLSMIILLLPILFWSRIKI